MQAVKRENMRQILQDLRKGRTLVQDVPLPGMGQNAVLIQTRASLISAGTERMLVEFGRASLLGKARAQPEKVKQVLNKIKSDGLLPTLAAVFERLDEPAPLGYCNAGTVLDVGSCVREFKPGDRVASNGPHAEIVCVPKTLCAKIPEGVSDEQAAFTVLSSIGLQGIRLAAPALGEKFVVFGLGLIGLVTAQMLCASGCEVMGVDINPDRLKLAKAYCAKTVDDAAGGDPVAAAGAWTEGKGADGVLITASAKADEIVHQSAQMCRKRGRIVLIGVVGLNLRRSDFYQKELLFQVSCSYGPGRYDDGYEQGGTDYPYGLVRWTEQRNFQAVLGMMRSRRLTVEELITHRFPLGDAPAAYEKIRSDRNALGVILQYPAEVDRATGLSLVSALAPASKRVVVGVIGAGNFSKMTLMPALSKTSARIAYIADLNGAAARHLASRHGTENAVTDYTVILEDPEVNTVLIAVGHNLHARLVCEVLHASKHAFVEKPLAMNPEELKKILAALEQASDRHVMVGFNRRFSPHVMKMKGVLAGRSEPLAATMTVNAGIVPPDHWVHDPIRGGGRIIGEACHFIDLMVHLTGSHVKTVAATMMGAGVAVKEDKMSISLGFEDGSIGTVNYFANGAKAYPKELLEVFSDGRVLRLENFRRTVGYGFRGFRKFKTLRQDKGHKAEFAALVNHAAIGGKPLIPLSDLVNVTLASFGAMTAARETRTIVLAKEYADLLS